MTATPAAPTTPGDPSRPEAAVPHPSSDAARLRRLLAAQSLITSDLPLREVLTRVVQLACELTGARSAALGIVDAEGRTELLVQAGASPRDIGVAVTDPDVAVAGDATMCFLGVPVVIDGQVTGEFYLADCPAGRFTAADDELVTALATIAATVVRKARRDEAARRHGEWAHAAHEITRALLADGDVDTVLDVISHALTLGEADMGLLALPDRDGTLRATVVVGRGAERYRDLVLDPECSPLGRLLTQGRAILCADLRELTGPAFDNVDNFGPVMSAPLVDARGLRGSVLLTRDAERAPFAAEDLAHLTMFADQVALALDLADARSDAEWLRELEVRHRIARDLHDNVIQRLFATGMGLHSITAAAVGLPGTIGPRLTRYVSELDETIDEIRERVFGLRDGTEERREVARFPRLRPRPMPGGRPLPGPRPLPVPRTAD